MIVNVYAYISNHFSLLPRTASKFLKLKFFKVMLNKTNKTHKKGFTMVELLIVFSIIILLVGIISSTFISFRKSQTLAYDTETVVSLLRQARAQTLSSKNLTVYGVHLAAPQAVLFTGSIYSSSDPLNEVFNLSSTDTILLISLTGGGNDVVFQRLTGETSQSGTIVISNPGLSQTKTVTIYKTGLIDSQ